MPESNLVERSKWRADPTFMPYMKKHRYTAVLHTALERIIDNRFGLTKNEMQVALAVIRKTWGFHRWSDRISLSQIRKLTNLDTRTISRCLNALEKRSHVLERISEHSWRNLKATEWAVERDTSKWGEVDAGDQSTPRGNHAPTLRAKHVQNERTNRPTTRDTLRDKNRYSRTASKKADYLQQLLKDGVQYEGLDTLKGVVR